MLLPVSSPNRPQRSSPAAAAHHHPRSSLLPRQQHQHTHNTQGLRVTRNRAAVFDVLASDDPEFGGLGAEAGVSVVRAAAAGSHACCLLSNLRLHLMALDDGDLMPLLLAEGEGEGKGAGSGAGGVWEGVEAMFMFGIQVGAVPGGVG